MPRACQGEGSEADLDMASLRLQRMGSMHTLYRYSLAFFLEAAITAPCPILRNSFPWAGLRCVDQDGAEQGVGDGGAQMMCPEEYGGGVSRSRGLRPKCILKGEASAWVLGGVLVQSQDLNYEKRLEELRGTSEASCLPPRYRPFS